VNKRSEGLLSLKADIRERDSNVRVQLAVALTAVMSCAAVTRHSTRTSHVAA
jgi:hypothetical protein